MVIEIPVTSALEDYQFLTTLENVVYGFRFKWNSRIEKWTMDIMNSNEEPIVEGLLVCVGISILDQYVSDSLPPGVLMFADSTDKYLDPGRNDLGDRVRAYYITSDDSVLAEGG